MGYSSLMLHTKIVTRLTQAKIDAALAKHQLRSIQRGRPRLPHNLPFSCLLMPTRH